MNVNYELVCDHEWPPSTAWQEGTFHFDVWERIKGICRAGRETERKGVEKKNTHFCPVFFFLRWTFKEPCDLHILSL